MSLNNLDEQFQEQLVNHLHLVQQLADHYSESLGFPVSTQDIRYAILVLFAEREDLNYVVEVSRVRLSYGEARTTLDGFDFRQFQSYIDVEAEELPAGFLPDTYASIKDGGRRWMIHLNDVDYWPSKPHAHFYAGNLVLDLSNGHCYKRWQYVETIPYKNLLSIRNKFEKVYEGKLPDLTVGA